MPITLCKSILNASLPPLTVNHRCANSKVAKAMHIYILYSLIIKADALGNIDQFVITLFTSFYIDHLLRPLIPILPDEPRMKSSTASTAFGCSRSVL